MVGPFGLVSDWPSRLPDSSVVLGHLQGSPGWVIARSSRLWGRPVSLPFPTTARKLASYGPVHSSFDPMPPSSLVSCRGHSSIFRINLVGPPSSSSKARLPHGIPDRTWGQGRRHFSHRDNLKRNNNERLSRQLIMKK
ncbi:unnamed protein product [Linum trigynum]|uniref:Uncharacterized protein n=1 Tax=Linum trigynum TaxID=586398 RepID=A0AAV2GAB0_9ROSI